MVSWKDFRIKCEIESVAKQEIIRELFDWVDNKKTRYCQTRTARQNKLWRIKNA